MLLLLLALVCCNVNVLGQTENDFDVTTCTLSDGRSGQCVNIQNCPLALNLLKLRQKPQICGYEGYEAIVCCYDPSPLANLANRRKPGEISLKKCDEYYPTQPPIYAIFLGNRSLVKEFPHMAIIGYGNEPDIVWACGGTLISEKFILTAAHCLNSRNLGPAKYVRVGDLDISTDTDDAQPQDFHIKQRISHPQYNPPSKYHDIALLELEKPVERTEYVDIACVNGDRFHNSTLLLTVTGWGKTEFSGNPSSYLLKAFVDLVPQNKCQAGYRRDIGTILSNGIVDDLMICAGGESDTCQGDSGGPLTNIHPKKTGFKKVYIVIGVTSFGKPCGNGKIPGVYTRVSHYIGWIEDIVWPNESLYVT